MKKTSLILTIFIAVLVSFAACKKEDGNVAPEKPFSPNPTHESINVETTISNVIWSCTDADEDALSYDVYFGTNENPELQATITDGASYDIPSELEPNTKYYWKIVAKDGNEHETTGNIWEFTTADNGGGGNGNLVLKIDTEVIDNSGSSSGVGQFCQVAIDSDNGLHIIYQDLENLKVKYAYKTAGGTWQKTDIGTCSESPFADIFVDKNNGVHIVYDEASYRNLKYGYKATGSSSFNISDISAGDYYVGTAYLSMAVDENLGVHIAFNDKGGSNFVASYLYKPDGGSWTNTIIDPQDQTGEEPGIVVDANNIHVSYGTLGGKVRYATKPIGSGAWTIEEVASSSEEIMYTAITKDNNDGLCIVYRDYADGCLKYAYKSTGGAWSVSTLESEYGGEHPGIAVNNQDTTHVSYSLGDDNVKYAYKVPGGNTWNIHNVDWGTQTYYQHTGIICGTNHHTYICYRKSSSQNSGHSVLAFADIYWAEE